MECPLKLRTPTDKEGMEASGNNNTPANKLTDPGALKQQAQLFAQRRYQFQDGNEDSKQYRWSSAARGT